MLDLTIFTEKYFDITMPTKEVINVKKPTQAMIIKLMDIQKTMIKLKKSNDTTAILNTYIEMLMLILNNNKENKHYDSEYIETNISMEMAQILSQEYLKFVNEIQKNPN